MKHPQHHKTVAVEATLKHASRAEDLQYELAILFATGKRSSQLRVG
jgi:hypothetical protein